MKLICNDVWDGNVMGVEKWVNEKLGRTVNYKVETSQTVFCQLDRCSIYADVTEDEYEALCLCVKEAIAIHDLGIDVRGERFFRRC